MAILIVDDEESTRLTIRDFLHLIGHKMVFEASNGAEALQLIDKRPDRIKMILSDWEMPVLDGLGFARELARRPLLNSAPFLLITSDLPESTLNEFQKSYSRMDGHLIKPFRAPVLENALSEAYAHRCGTRELAVFLGREIPRNLVQALRSRTGFASRILHIRNVEECQKALSHPEQLWALLIIDPAQLDPGVFSLLSGFKRTPPGLDALTILVTHSSHEIPPIRDWVDLAGDESWNTDAWGVLIQSAQVRSESLWSIKLWVKRTKAAIYNKKWSPALKSIQQALKLDPSNPTALAIQGDILRAKGDTRKAIVAYQSSLTANPYMPHSYIQLMRIFSMNNSPALQDIASQAARFCPHNEDVLAEVKKITGKAPIPKE